MCLKNVILQINRRRSMTWVVCMTVVYQFYISMFMECSHHISFKCSLWTSIIGNISSTSGCIHDQTFAITNQCTSNIFYEKLKIKYNWRKHCDFLQETFSRRRMGRILTILISVFWNKFTVVILNYYLKISIRKSFFLLVLLCVD